MPRPRAVIGAVVLALCVAGVARGDDALPAPAARADTTLDQFLQGLADSTSDYFGVSAARSDTSGLDSALVYRLAHPLRTRLKLGFAVFPDFAFQRVGGPAYWLVTHTGDLRDLGQLEGAAGWAAGPNVGLWRVNYLKRFGSPARHLDLEGYEGLETSTMDRDARTPRITTVTAFVLGRDGQNYLRRRGWRVAGRLVFRRVDFAAAYRDMQEDPLATTAAWDLAHRRVSTYLNLPAFPGRAHEFELGGGINLPRLPVRIELVHLSSSAAIGSDLEYRRTRVAASGNWGIGRFASLVPQALYGRERGEPVPQAAFYLGGTHTLRSIGSDTHAGTGLALARLDLIGTQDVLRLAHIPHPDFLPIQLGAFTAAGAVWGEDPFGGPTHPGVDWPARREWRTEAGASLIYQPGIPDPTSLMRFNAAWALGPDGRHVRYTIEYSRAMEFTSVFGR